MRLVITHECAQRSPTCHLLMRARRRERTQHSTRHTAHGTIHGTANGTADGRATRSTAHTEASRTTYHTPHGTRHSTAHGTTLHLERYIAYGAQHGTLHNKRYGTRHGTAYGTACSMWCAVCSTARSTACDMRHGNWHCTAAAHARHAPRVHTTSTRHRNCTRHGTSWHHTWGTAQHTIESEFESNLECCNSNIRRLECWGSGVEGRSGAGARKPADFQLPSSMQAHRAEKLMRIPPSIDVFIHSHCSTSFWYEVVK